MHNAGETEAELFDGTSALRHAVSLVWDDSGLTLHTDRGTETLAWTRLTALDHRPGTQVIGRSDRPGWRLLVRDDAPAALMARLPRAGRYGHWIDRVGLVRAGVLLAAASAVVAAAVLTAPGWLGPLVPPSWERRIGTAMIGDLSPYTCHTPEADAALAALAAKVDPGGDPVQVQLAKVGMVNAVALPGGRVLLFDGLVQQASSADELAGVVAHELGHVRQRHVMQALLRQFGLSALLSGVNGNLGGTLNGLASMQYSRRSEAAADAFSRAQLAAADISPAPTAAFFHRLGEGPRRSGKSDFSYLDSHPDTALREQAFAAAVRPRHTYRPTLSSAQFHALRAACTADTNARAWTLF